MIAFGPVPSRRLGDSLGINNIFPKFCSYACVYCQVGHTNHMQIRRRPFYSPHTIFRDVQTRVSQVLSKQGHIDYLSIVPEGEPTLDIQLGETIRLLKVLGYPVAVFTNSSLLWMDDVREDLCRADWVSLKVDTVDEVIWHKLNKPHGQLELDRVLKGIMQFRNEFTGKLATETMLVKNVNDPHNVLLRTVTFLEQLAPEYAFIATPSRPPVERWVQKPDLDGLYRAYKLFSQYLKQVDMLLVERGSQYGATGLVEEDLLRTLAVQPMTEEAVRELLKRNNAGWYVVEKMIADEQLAIVEYDGHKFVVRCHPEKAKKTARKNH
ncbi:MAG: radical SAM protein [Calditrichaeota bacterium]|nr:radical SAM protein [Calditrichota bacterium]MCB9067487.1 radical SAM protein [Calditrichia bacterium]